MASRRIFQDVNGDWYFRVRGNQAEGPYASAEEAQAALGEYVSRWNRRHMFGTRWLSLPKLSCMLRRRRQGQMPS